MVIYQMMTRLFGNKTQVNKPFGTLEENGVGKFNDITEEALAGIKELGVTHVWYTGVLEHALINDYTAYGIPLDDADVVKGRAGSPYAIKDYYDVNPDLAVDVRQRMAEFEALMARTHQAGMKVLIDFVPNHVARSYQSDARPEGTPDLGEFDDTTVAFKASNNFYYIPGEAFQVPTGYVPLGNGTFKTKDGQYQEFPAKATGNDQFTAKPSVDDWFETVKLNYGIDYLDNRKAHFDPVPDTWVKMKDILVFWAEKGVDGFRCDMAEMVPVAFWNWAVPKVKAVNPAIIFIAEIYNPAQYHNYIDQGGFDFLYDKVELYDTLKSIIQGRATTDDLPKVWQSMRGINKHMLRFLENHDEQRLASPYFAGTAQKGFPAMTLSATLYSGPVMLYFGQEVGEPGEGTGGFSSNDGRTTIFDYWGVPSHQRWMNNGKFDGGALTPEEKEIRQFYKNLLQFTAASPAIARGKFVDLHQVNRSQPSDYNEQVYAFLRFVEGEKLLIVVSFDPNITRLAPVKIPEYALEAMGFAKQQTLQVTQVFPAASETKTVEWNEWTKGLSVRLDPLASVIYRLE